MPPHRPNTPISAESSFTSRLPCPSSRPPPPGPPPLSSVAPARDPVTPPEEELEEGGKLEDPQTHPTELSPFLASIEAFLRGDYLYGNPFTLTQVSPSCLEEFQRWALNRGLHRLRYTYDTVTSTLKLLGMITTVHGAINQWLTEIYGKLPLSDEERSHIMRDTGYDIPLQNGAVRQPDAAFRYVFFDDEEGEEVTDPYPCVIFEVAFAQKHDNVRRAAVAWLKGTSGMVKVAVAVNIEEGHRPAAAGGAGGMERGGGAGGENQEGESAGSEAESEELTSARAIADFHKRCNPSDLVGPLTATIELFRLGDDGETERDGPIYKFLPDRSPDVDPVLRISDLLRDTSVDDQRTVTLPLERYGQLINMAKRGLAVMRKARQKTDKRKRVEEGGTEGGDYVTEDLPEREAKKGRILRSGGGAGGGGRGGDHQGGDVQS